MRFNTLSEWLEWLEEQHPVSIDLGLERIHKVASHLDILSFTARIVTVAGTNGKGSTSKIIYELLLSLSKDRAVNIGLYTSPHLIAFNERIIINNELAKDSEIIAAFAHIDNAIQRINESGSEVTLTYFEYTTLAALWLFQQADLDYIILEVGLGGRLDAVNIVEPEVSVITSIDLDHQEFLGTTRSEIALEKAGIARQGKPVVIGEEVPPESLLSHLGSIGAKAYWYSKSVPAERMSHYFSMLDNGEYSWRGLDADNHLIVLKGLTEPELYLSNWSCALQVVSLLGFPLTTDTVNLLLNTTLRGRCSVHQWKNRSFILDVAHNTEAVKLLRKKIMASTNNKSTNTKCIAIFAALNNKPVVEMLNIMEDCVDDWLFPSLNQVQRAMPAELILDQYKAIKKTIPNKKHQNQDVQLPTLYESVESAMKSAIVSSDQDDKILVFGSFYTVSQAMQVMMNSVEV